MKVECKTCLKLLDQNILNFSISKGVWKGKAYQNFKIHCRNCHNSKVKECQANYYRTKKQLEILNRVKSFVQLSCEPRQYYDNEREMLWIKPWKIDLQGEELEIYNSL
jgi:hypothetical protein